MIYENVKARDAALAQLMDPAIRASMTGPELDAALTEHWAATVTPCGSRVELPTDHTTTTASAADRDRVTVFLTCMNPKGHRRDQGHRFEWRWEA